MWYFTVAFRTPNVVNYTIRATTDIPAPAAIALNSAEQPVMQKLLAVVRMHAPPFITDISPLILLLRTHSELIDFAFAESSELV